ncbi:DNA polymerase, partial [Salmonella sp. SAL4437]|uniref:DNA polymerase n=1 Tax=Salmonella sp. SAL4437 TaxID=3159892 RepID=UPI003978F72B
HMERTGICVDPKAMGSLGEELRTRMKEIQGEITAIAGDEVNINSPKQLSEVLFTKLQLPVVKRTKSGPSTDQSVLEALAEQ